MYLLALFVDALRYDYINSEDSPFLYEAIQSKRIRQLRSKPVLGFTHTATASIYTGTWPRTHGRWVYWGNKKGEEADVYPVQKIFRLIPEKKIRLFAKHGFSYLLELLKSPASEWFMPNLPENMAPFFCRLTPVFNLDQSVGHIPTLFGILRKMKIDYSFKNIESLDIKDFEVKIPISDKDVFVNVLSYGHLDHTGHIYGPSSQPISKEVQKLDQFICGLFNKLSRITSDLHLVVFTDHGMTKVEKRFNLQGLIEALRMRSGLDYLAFYDSTMARFWFMNERARSIIIASLKKLQYGKILEKSDLKKLGLDFGNNNYGDLIFLMNVGCEIFPNYFVSILPSWIRQYKGMHGFDVEDPSQQGAFLYSGSLSEQIITETIEAVDFLPTILHILKLPIPQYCEGSSIFKH
jgi:predicted AlkP superfamily pyrophosphatase or phosphodiesterase